MSRYAVGMKYTTELELTPIIPRDPQGKAVIAEKVYLDGVAVSYIDSGTITAEVKHKRTGRSAKRAVRSDYGSDLGLIPTTTNLPQDRVLTETGRRYLSLRGRAEDITVTVRSDSPLPVRIAGISQTGTIIQ